MEGESRFDETDGTRVLTVTRRSDITDTASGQRTVVERRSRAGWDVCWGEGGARTGETTRTISVTRTDAQGSETSAETRAVRWRSIPTDRRPRPGVREGRDDRRVPPREGDEGGEGPSGAATQSCERHGDGYVYTRGTEIDTIVVSIARDTVGDAATGSKALDEMAASIDVLTRSSKPPSRSYDGPSSAANAAATRSVSASRSTPRRRPRHRARLEPAVRRRRRRVRGRRPVGRGDASDRPHRCRRHRVHELRPGEARQGAPAFEAVHFGYQARRTGRVPVGEAGAFEAALVLDLGALVVAMRTRDGSLWERTLTTSGGIPGVAELRGLAVGPADGGSGSAPFTYEEVIEVFQPQYFTATETWTGTVTLTVDRTAERMTVDLAAAEVETTVDDSFGKRQSVWYGERGVTLTAAW